MGLARLFMCHHSVVGSIPSLGTTFRLQVVPKPSESLKKPASEPVFCCLCFSSACPIFRGISGANPVRSISCPYGDAPMPRQTTPLTDSAIKAAKPYKVTNDQGLYLEIMPNGSKLWRHTDRERRLALGVYPTVSLLPSLAEHGTERARI